MAGEVIITITAKDRATTTIASVDRAIAKMGTAAARVDTAMTAGIERSNEAWRKGEVGLISVTNHLDSMTRHFFYASVQIGALALGVNAITKAIEGYEKGMGDAATYIEEGYVGLSKYRGELNKLMKDYGYMPTVTLNSVRDILSAQVPLTEMPKMLESAMKFSRVRTIELDTATKALTKTINTLGMKYADVDKVSSVLAKAIDLGDVAGQNLAENWPVLTGSLATLHLNLVDLAAMFSTISRGPDPAMTITQVKNAMLEFTKATGPAKKAMVEFTHGEAELTTDWLKANGPVKFFEILKKYKPSPEMMRKFFPDMRAYSGAQFLLEYLDIFKKFHGDLKSVYGDANYLEDMLAERMERVDVRLDKMRASFHLMLVDVGEGLLPTINNLIDLMDKLTDSAGTSESAAKKYGPAIVKAIVGSGIIIILGSLTRAFVEGGKAIRDVIALAAKGISTASKWYGESGIFKSLGKMKMSAPASGVKFITSPLSEEVATGVSGFTKAAVPTGHMIKGTKYIVETTSEVSKLEVAWLRVTGTLNIADGAMGRFIATSTRVGEIFARWSGVLTILTLIIDSFTRFNSKMEKVTSFATLLENIVNIGVGALYSLVYLVGDAILWFGKLSIRIEEAFYVVTGIKLPFLDKMRASLPELIQLWADFKTATDEWISSFTSDISLAWDFFAKECKMAIEAAMKFIAPLMNIINAIRGRMVSMGWIGGVTSGNGNGQGFTNTKKSVYDFHDNWMDVGTTIGTLPTVTDEGTGETPSDLGGGGGSKKKLYGVQDYTDAILELRTAMDFAKASGADLSTALGNTLKSTLTAALKPADDVSDKFKNITDAVNSAKEQILDTVFSGAVDNLSTAFEELTNQGTNVDAYMESVVYTLQQLSNGAITAAQALQYLQDIYSQLGKTGPVGASKKAEKEKDAVTVTLEEDSWISKVLDGMTEIKFSAGEVAQFMTDSFMTAFNAIADGTKTPAEAFADMGRDLIKTIIQMIQKMLIYAAILLIIKAIFGGSAGFEVGDILSMAVKAGAGISMQKEGGIMRGIPMRSRMYAGGGVAMGPEMAIYGEGDRSEAFVPLSGNRRIPVEMNGRDSEPKANYIYIQCIDSKDIKQMIEGQAQTIISVVDNDIKGYGRLRKSLKS